jgi:hypothetical protein
MELGFLWTLEMNAKECKQQASVQHYFEQKALMKLSKFVPVLN